MTLCYLELVMTSMIRGAIAAGAWAYQNPLGRHEYRREHRRRLDRAAVAGSAR